MQYAVRRTLNAIFSLLPFPFSLFPSHLPLMSLCTNTYVSIRHLYVCREISTTVKSPLQISPFCSNKPNFRKSQMNVNKVLTKDYEKKTLGQHGKNKPNSNPIQTQSKPIQTQNKPKQTQLYLNVFMAVEIHGSFWYHTSR